MRRSDFIFRYRVRNWPAYNKALIPRGSLTFWVDEQAVRGWRAESRPGPRGGRPRFYADTAIECALVVKTVFHLSLRVTQGFLESVVRLMDVELPVPDYTTVCRRQGGLELDLGARPTHGPRHVVIDTTGLKVFGAGEWYVRKHGMGRGRRRTWRKLHLGVDDTTTEIVPVDLTASAVHDSPHLPMVLDQVADDVCQVSGDRAYDSGRCYQAILARDATATIPPRRNARVSTAKDPPAYRVERDTVLRRIKEEGRYVWRTSSGATRQSLAESPDCSPAARCMSSGAVARVRRYRQRRRQPEPPRPPVPLVNPGRALDRRRAARPCQNARPVTVTASAVCGLREGGEITSDRGFDRPSTRFAGRAPTARFRPLSRRRPAAAARPDASSL